MDDARDTVRIGRYSPYPEPPRIPWWKRINDAIQGAWLDVHFAFRRWWVAALVIVAVVIAMLLLAGCALFRAASAPTQDLNGDGYINEADVPLIRAAASAVPGGTAILDLVGYGIGALGLGGAAHQAVRRKRMRDAVNDAILADPDTDEVLAEKLNGDLKPEAREKIKRKRIERETMHRTRESVEARKA